MKRSLLLFSLMMGLMLAIAPGHSQSLNEKWLDLVNKGKEKYALNSYQMAIGFFQQAAQLIPTDTTAHVYLMDCGYKAGEEEIVYKAHENLQFLNYDSPRLQELLIATARDVEKNYPKALGFVQEALEKYPGNTEILWEEINVYYKKGDYPSTKEKIAGYLNAVPGHIDAHQLLIHIYSEYEHDYKKALQAALQAQQAVPDHLEFKIQEADFYFRLGDFEKAKSRIEELIQLNPEEPKLYYNLALLFFKEGDYATSAEICKKAIELDPDYLDAIYNVGTFYYYEGLKYNRALSEMSVEQYTYNNQGRDFEMEAIRNLKLAKPYFEKAIELNPDELDAYENLNTINVLLSNLEGIVAEDVPQTLHEVPDTVVNVGRPFLFVKNLAIDYPENSDGKLRKGQTARLNFIVENLGNAPGENLTVVLLQPVIIPGLEFKSSLPIEQIAPGESEEITVSLHYRPNEVSSSAIEKIDQAENKLRVFVREPNGYNADLTEFSVNLTGDTGLGDERITISGTEDIDFTPTPVPENYLLVIGIDQYLHWPDLYNAVGDAKAVRDILLQKYRFDDENVYELYNQDATHENIRNALIKIKNELDPIDNLVIYYAGHGDYDPEFDEGAWIPHDAQEGYETEYIPNVVLIKYLQKLETRHTFLMADACFSGSLFVEDDEMRYKPGNDEIKSRWAFSSGNMEYVADGAKGGHSPFAENLLACLEENNREKLTVTDVIGYVKFKVKTGFSQTPIGKPLDLEDNQGGEYVFYLK
jgi:tetratricopeptide (TPR) repeat protein